MTETREQCKSCSAARDGGCAGQTCEPQVSKALYGTLNDIKRVVAVMSGKGGVGKSTVTSVLAVGLNGLGYKVGILDADITGPSIPKAFGIGQRQLKATDFGIMPRVTAKGIRIMSVNFFLPHEDDPVIWRGPMLAGLIQQFWSETDWRELDYLLVDLPPGTGDVPLTVLQTLPVDSIIVVSSPQDLVLMVVKKTVKMARKMNIPIAGVVENMSYAVCSCCGEKLELFGASKLGEIEASLGLKELARLPWDVELRRLMDEGKTEEYSSEEISRLTEELVKIIPPLNE